MTEHPPIVVEPRVYQFPDEEIDHACRSELSIFRPEDPLITLESFVEPVAFICRSSSWDDIYLKKLPKGSWVITTGVGYERYPIKDFIKHDIALTNNPGINAKQVAEHAFGMAFTLTRQILFYRDNQRHHEWRKLPGMTDLADEDCCIIGLGGVGEAIAKRAQAFGMTVRGVKRTVQGYRGHADTVYTPNELLDALYGTNLVVVAVPLTNDTRGMIGDDELRVISNDAIVINLARGPVLETDALIRSLSKDELRSAGLDVTDPEPLPPDSPLWDRPDVLITPHCAGRSDKQAERFVPRFLDQYDRWRGSSELRDRIA